MKEEIKLIINLPILSLFSYLHWSVIWWIVVALCILSESFSILVCALSCCQAFVVMNNIYGTLICTPLLHNQWSPELSLTILGRIKCMYALYTNTHCHVPSYSTGSNCLPWLFTTSDRILNRLRYLNVSDLDWSILFTNSSPRYYTIYFRSSKSKFICRSLIIITGSCIHISHIKVKGNFTGNTRKAN